MGFASLWGDVGIVNGSDNVSRRLGDGFDTTNQGGSEEHLLLGVQSNTGDRQHYSTIKVAVGSGQE